jgi:hypothetical protein
VGLIVTLSGAAISHRKLLITLTARHGHEVARFAVPHNAALRSQGRGRL